MVFTKNKEKLPIKLQWNCIQKGLNRVEKGVIVVNTL